MIFLYSSVIYDLNYNKINHIHMVVIMRKINFVFTIIWKIYFFRHSHLGLNHLFEHFHTLLVYPLKKCHFLRFQFVAKAAVFVWRIDLLLFNYEKNWRTDTFKISIYKLQSVFMHRWFHNMRNVFIFDSYKLFLTKIYLQTVAVLCFSKLSENSMLIPLEIFYTWLQLVLFWNRLNKYTKLIRQPFNIISNNYRTIN